MQLCLCSRSPPWKLNPLLRAHYSTPHLLNNVVAVAFSYLHNKYSSSSERDDESYWKVGMEWRGLIHAGQVCPQLIINNSHQSKVSQKEASLRNWVGLARNTVAWGKNWYAAVNPGGNFWALTLFWFLHTPGRDLALLILCILGVNFQLPGHHKQTHQPVTWAKGREPVIFPPKPKGSLQKQGSIMASGHFLWLFSLRDAQARDTHTGWWEKKIPKVNRGSRSCLARNRIV